MESMASYAGLGVLAGAWPSGSASQSSETQEFEYPVPLFVKNTFIDAKLDRPASLEGFLHERQAFSCPTSMVSEPGSNCDGTRAAYPKLMPYCPGQTFKKSAAFGSSAPLAMFPMGGAQSKAAAPASLQTADTSLHTVDQDSGSECSTADTAARPPPSPALEVARALGTADAAACAGPVPAMPSLESPALPSVGSAGHDQRQCKPCAFMHTKGCSSGADCQFCHLCGPGEKQRRQKEKRIFFGSMRQLQKMAAAGISGE